MAEQNPINDYINEEENANGKFVWILIQGCIETTSNIKISRKTGSTNNGIGYSKYGVFHESTNNYLIAMALDTANMEFFINRNTKHHHFYTGVSSNHSITTNMILNEIIETCKYAKRVNAKGVQLYYTGHSETNTGNWIFKNGVITFHEIISIIMDHWGHECFDIYCDCDYAGNWAKELYKYSKQLRLVSVHGACWPAKCAYNSPHNGGYFTLVQSGRKSDHQIDALNRCEAVIQANNQYLMTYWGPNGPKKMKAVERKRKPVT